VDRGSGNQHEDMANAASSGDSAPRAVSSNVEEADVVAGADGVGTGVVTLSGGDARRVEFSLVNGLAIFEGDIELGQAGEMDAIQRALADSLGEMQAAVVADVSKRWPNGQVPFEPLDESSPIRSITKAAMDEISRQTTVNFVPREAGHADYIVFEPAAFCSSRVGRTGGRQVVHLSADSSLGNVLHELCHVVGLWHEQSRKDRDAYVKVRWENILGGYEHNFRQQVSDGDDVGPYDFGSIMHYPPNAFSRNGDATLEAVSGNATFGQRLRLSDGDLAAINTLYGQPAPDTTQPIDASVGNGVQFRVTIDPEGVARVVTNEWPSERVIHWDVVCIDGPANAGPLLTWSYAVGLSNDKSIDYFFTIKNLTREPVTAEARYVMVR
jgi:hypothetical protein